MIVEFIDDTRTGGHGVESICAELKELGCGIAPSTYYNHKNPVPSARAVQDRAWMIILIGLWVTNNKVYGVDKLWKAARRAGHDIGRDQTRRLMRELGIQGVTRRRKVFTTRPDPDHTRAADLVNRDFTAAAPNLLWVTDLTYVPTRAGMAYVCFITDVFSRRIVGWSVTSHMRKEMVLDALEMARLSRGLTKLKGLITHSDAGSQFTSVRFTERLEEIGASPSIGTVADSYDNALAETINGLYKAECIYGPDSTGWDTHGDVELATLGWVHWFNHQRLHSWCGDIPPAEHEEAFYASQQTTPTRVGIQ